MGRRGPPPRPKHVMALAGSWRADHREELGSFFDTLPDPPAWMRPRAQAIFSETCHHLDEMGVLARSDVYVVCRYAATLDRWLSAEEELSKSAIHFHAMAGRNGEEKSAKPSPAFAQSAACHDQLRNLETVLGLTPADRTRLGVSVMDKQQAVDPMSKLLG